MMMETRVQEEACIFVELAAEGLQRILSGLYGSRVGILYGGCNFCQEALPCYQFCSTPFRPELCVSHHGAAHHAAINHNPAAGEADGGDQSGRSSRSRSAKLRAIVLESPIAELLSRCTDFLTSIGAAGVSDLLGLKRTAGSIEGRLPPSRRTLLAALDQPHVTPPLTPRVSQTKMAEICPTEALKHRGHSVPANKKFRRLVYKLSVGGRALCKHAIRGKDEWWGTLDGTEEDKNERARKIVLHILATATWVNIHALGGGGQDGVLEVRQAQGYGARWSVDGAVFRGFLEPHMENGYTRGWRH